MAQSKYYPAICLEGLRNTTKTLRIACLTATDVEVKKMWIYTSTPPYTFMA
jgi:hypothetical protein